MDLSVAGVFTPAAEGHGLCPWMNAPAFGRDVAPLGREVGCHGLCPWGSTLMDPLLFAPRKRQNIFVQISRTVLCGYFGAKRTVFGFLFITLANSVTDPYIIHPA